MFVAFLILIFSRPYISSLAFPDLNYLYSLIFIGFLAIWYISKRISLKRIQDLKFPLLLFCLALAISMVFSSDKLNSLKELSKYINNLLLFLVVISLTYENKIRVIRTIILAGLIISLLAIYQYFFGFRHLLNYIAKSGITDAFTLDYILRKRVFFPFVTPNALAGYLAMLIPISLIQKNKLYYIIPLSAALLLTKSLSALLSIFLALTIYYYLQGKLKKEGGFFLLGLLLIIGLIFMARSTTQKQHLQPVFSTLMRLNYWRDSLSMIKTAPLTGVGLGNFNLAQSRYAHNSYLQIWAEMGILGLLSFLWLVISILNRSLKAMKNSPDKAQIIALIASTAVFLIHNSLDFSFFLPEVSLIWWVILGCLCPA